MKRNIELGNMATMTCGKRILWPGEKYSSEHFILWQEKEASVFYIESPYQVTLTCFEIFMYM